MTHSPQGARGDIALLAVTIGFAVSGCANDATRPALRPSVAGAWTFTDQASWHDGYSCSDTAQLQLKTDSVGMIQVGLANGVAQIEKAAWFSGTTRNWIAVCSDGVWHPATWDVFGILFLERADTVQFNFEDGGHPVQTQFGTLSDAGRMSGTLEGHDEGSPWDFTGTWSAVRRQ